MSTSDLKSWRFVAITTATAAGGCPIPAQFTLYAHGKRRLMVVQSTAASTVGGTGSPVWTLSNFFTKSDFPPLTTGSQSTALYLPTPISVKDATANILITYLVAIATDGTVGLYDQTVASTVLVSGGGIPGALNGDSWTIPQQTVEWDVLI